MRLLNNTKSMNSAKKVMETMTSSKNKINSKKIVFFGFSLLPIFFLTGHVLLYYYLRGFPCLDRIFFSSKKYPCNLNLSRYKALG